MTYFGFLFIFLGIPLILLAWATWRDARHGLSLPFELTNWTPTLIVAAHVVVAVLYTTPWDNYLVATRVWWYDPALVTGIVLGWVPLEEYIFFVVQTLMTGLWIFYLARRYAPHDPAPARPGLRLVSTLVVFIIWLASVAILVSGWRPGTYLGLELSWALLPIMLQLGFGADILWHYRRLVFWGIVPTTLYLSAADALAISSGTWTIDPAQSLQFYLGGVLPVEEFIFFFLTNTLVTLGVILVSALQSQQRLDNFLARRFTGRKLSRQS